MDHIPCLHGHLAKVSPRLLRETLPSGQGRRRGQTSQATALDHESSWKQTQTYWGEHILSKDEKAKKPVGGGAVDVDTVADICFLIPEVFKDDVWK